MKEKLTHVLQREDYLFDTTTKIVTILNGTKVVLENVGLITNVTTNETLYNPLCDGYGGTIASGSNQIVLERAIPAAMKNTDNLIIVIVDNLEYGGKNKDEKKVTETNSHYNKEVLKELKKINLHFAVITGNSFTEQDINNE